MSDSSPARKQAQRRLETFKHSYDRGIVLLACHAALPVVLNSELLHLIRINFFLDPPEPLSYLGESELLLSPICQEIGADLYEIEPELRNLLLQELKKNKNYGHERVREVAGLLWQYIDRRSPWEDHIRLKRAQQLTALNFLNSEKAQEWLANAEEGSGYSESGLKDWFVAMYQELQSSDLRDEPQVSREHSRKRVLIVDDNPEVRARLRSIFQDLGYQVNEAASNADALDLLLAKRLDFSLVTTDALRYPDVAGENGMAGLKLVRIINQNLPELPVVLISLDSADELKHEAPELHLHGFFSKTLTDAELRDAFTEILTGEIPPNPWSERPKHDGVFLHNGAIRHNGKRVQPSGQASLEGFQFEQQIADIFRKVGAKIQEEYPADKGMDLYVELKPQPDGPPQRLVVQAKRMRSNELIDAFTIQSFATSMDHLKKEYSIDKFILVSNNGFSQEARIEAQKSGINLFTLDELESALSINGQKVRQEIEELLALNQIEEALERLAELDIFRKESILLSRRWHDIQEKQRQQLLTDERMESELNKLVDVILEIIGQFDLKLSRPSEPKSDIFLKEGEFERQAVQWLDLNKKELENEAAKYVLERLPVLGESGGCLDSSDKIEHFKTSIHERLEVILAYLENHLSISEKGMHILRSKSMPCPSTAYYYAFRYIRNEIQQQKDNLLEPTTDEIQQQNNNLPDPTTEEIQQRENDLSWQAFDVLLKYIDCLIEEYSDEKRKSAKPQIHLRSEPLTVSQAEFKKVFGLDDNRRPHEYVQNEYEDWGEVVFDRATGLLWQKSGSDGWLSYEKAVKYVKELNSRNFASYADWRMPTIPELMSLLELEKQTNDLYIHQIFDKNQKWYWSADRRIKGGSSIGSTWTVTFDGGNVYWSHIRYQSSVRCVRS